jgi:hypothetical protein
VGRVKVRATTKWPTKPSLNGFSRDCLLVLLGFAPDLIRPQVCLLPAADQHGTQSDFAVLVSERTCSLE